MHEESLLIRRRVLDVVDSKHHKCRKLDEDDDPLDGVFAKVQGFDAPEEFWNAARGHQPRTNKVAKEVVRELRGARARPNCFVAAGIRDMDGYRNHGTENTGCEPIDGLVNLSPAHRILCIRANNCYYRLSALRIQRDEGTCRRVRRVRQR